MEAGLEAAQSYTPSTTQGSSWALLGRVPCPCAFSTPERSGFGEGLSHRDKDKGQEETHTLRV